MPTTKHELQIVLQTWHCLLVLLTVENSISTEGLALILEKFDDHHQVMQEMFSSVEDFGLTVLVILNNHLQKFFDMVTDVDNVTKASSCQRHFLWRQASDFLKNLDNQKPPSVVVPQCLRRTPAVHDEDKGATAAPRSGRRRKSQRRRLRQMDSGRQSTRNPSKHGRSQRDRPLSISSVKTHPMGLGGQSWLTRGPKAHVKCASDSGSRAARRHAPLPTLSGAGCRATKTPTSPRGSSQCAENEGVDCRRVTQFQLHPSVH